MTEILLIRHGETAWNATKRLQGHLDIPLNPVGERQAAALGRALKEETFDVVFSSDLSRARQTARAIAEPQARNVCIDPALRERCYGGFEGLLRTEIAHRYPDAYAAWQARDMDARFPDGERPAETLREFSQRAVNAIRRIVEEGELRKVAIVTHGGVLECAYRAAQGIGFAHARDFDIFNTAINRFEWNAGALRLLQWGDVAHLQVLAVPVLDEVDRSQTIDAT